MGQWDELDNELADRRKRVRRAEEQRKEAEQRERSFGAKLERAIVTIVIIALVMWALITVIQAANDPTYEAPMPDCPAAAGC